MRCALLRLLLATAALVAAADAPPAFHRAPDASARIFAARSNT